VASIKLTEKSVARLIAPTASGKQEIHWDLEQPGFGVLCSGVSETKTFIAQTRINNTKLKRRVTIGRCDRLRISEAREKAKEVLAQMDLGEDPKASGRELSLKLALEAYIAGNKKLRPSSINGYRGWCEQHLGDWLDRPLGEITRTMVEQRHADISAKIETKPNGYSGQSTANAVFRAFRAIYNFAADRDEALPPNPVKILKRRWFEDKRRERMVRFDQLLAFYAAVCDLENQVAADYIKLLLFTGLRRTEAASLRWADIEFAAKTFSISGDRTKNGEKLTLPMSDLVSDLLIARRRIGRAEFIFPANSKSGHIQELKFAFDEIERSTGIKVSPHDLRRTFMTLADSLDISTLAIKALVNHAAPRDVTSGYIIMKVERLRAPAQRIADKIRELCGIARPEGENVAIIRSI
jgi:integrase